MKRYNPKEIEPKWQQKWAEDKLYEAGEASGRPKKHILEYFPYPSGAAMHVGHVRNYVIGDALMRFNRMRGYNVLHPMGWDAFGLPAENYAIKTGISPQEIIKASTAKFKQQLTQMGFGYDWSREFASSDPDYYKWTQWFFLLLHKRGLAYRKESLQWWCPVDKTVLANEQVENGQCWRCGSVVEKKALPQWFFKITDYADRLAADLEDLNWSEGVKSMQRNWIGRSKGAEIDFRVNSSKLRYVLVHGFMGSPADNDWLKSELEKLGHEVIVPQMPNSAKPIESEWVDALLHAAEYDENTVLFGYSLGAVAAMKVLERINTKVAGLVLAGGFVDPHFADHARNFESKFDWSFDAAKIRRSAGKIQLLHDTTDTAVSAGQAERLSKMLDTPITHVKAEKPHFCGEHEPVLLKALAPAIKAFTTRPDTIYGATFMVLAPEHPLVHDITTDEQRGEVNNYVKQAQAKSDIERQETEREKTGVFTGAYAVNPASNDKIPIWIADYVLYGYGTGAIMAVPAHDQRDFEFAKQFGLPIKQVVMPCEADKNNPPREGFEEVERETVVVHLRDKSTGKFALLDWHGSLEGITTAIMGGIEQGQTPEEAALMEIKEEAALEGVRILKKSPWITGAKYCASHKGQNRKALAHVLLAEVDSLDGQGVIADSEKKTHTLTWASKEDVVKRLTPEHQKQMWELLWAETALPGEGEMINSGQYDGLASSEAREKIVADLERQGAGKERVNHKIRDWLISRQRYWGAPIPMIHCEKCGTVPVPEEQLPVVLPEMESYEPSGDGRSPLANVPEFVNTECPKCGGAARRETDTMDGFACSSWYFLRFADPHNTDKPFDTKHVKYWLPVDDYIGGAEHAVMHLLYARFWVKVMYDEGLVDFQEPFKTLRNQGMILAPDGAKMSKSKGNTIEPGHLIEQGYGADAIRIMELFIGPWNQMANWSVEGMGGSYRFLQRIWILAQEYLERSDVTENTADDIELKRTMHQAIHRVSKDLEELGFNTAVAALMETVNELYKLKTRTPFAAAPQAWKRSLETLLQLLNPFAPHMAEELWRQLGHGESINLSSWPVHDEKYLVSDTMTIVVQVNGKVRANLELPSDAPEEQVLQAARANENIVQYMQAEPRKSIYVPKKLVNFVV